MLFNFSFLPRQINFRRDTGNFSAPAEIPDGLPVPDPYQFEVPPEPPKTFLQRHPVMARVGGAVAGGLLGGGLGVAGGNAYRYAQALPYYSDAAMYNQAASIYARNAMDGGWKAPLNRALGGMSSFVSGGMKQFGDLKYQSLQNAPMYGGLGGALTGAIGGYLAGSRMSR